MLAPVARLLEITPDILLSFQEDVSQEEINQIVHEVDEKFRKEESYEDIFQFVKKKIARYPNSERLAGQLAMIMDAWRILRRKVSQLFFGEGSSPENTSGNALPEAGKNAGRLQNI